MGRTEASLRVGEVFLRSAYGARGQFNRRISTRLIANIEEFSFLFISSNWPRRAPPADRPAAETFLQLRRRGATLMANNISEDFNNFRRNFFKLFLPYFLLTARGIDSIGADGGARGRRRGTGRVPRRATYFAKLSKL